MKVIKFNDEASWKEFRRGKITGSRLKGMVSKKNGERKIGFYELIAERLGIPSDDGSAMERGRELEPEAIGRFEEATGKKVDHDLVVWQSDDNKNIACSPDGWIGNTEAVEVKCLASSRHIQAVIENKVPDDYYYQAIQYFIVNEKLKSLFFVFYDPRLKVKDLHIIELKREQLEDDILEMKSYQDELLKEVSAIIKELAAF